MLMVDGRGRVEGGRDNNGNSWEGKRGDENWRNAATMMMMKVSSPNHSEVPMSLREVA